MVVVLMFWYLGGEPPRIANPDAPPAFLYGVYSDLSACLTGAKELVSRNRTTQWPGTGPKPEMKWQCFQVDVK
jgi:hypothetical protein